MSGRTTADFDGSSFVFSDENLREANIAISQYPSDRKAAAIMQLLHIAQKQLGGYVSEPAMRYVAKMLEIPLGQVKEVLGFYSMYNTEKPGKYLIQVCRTVPCHLCSAASIREKFEQVLNIKVGQTTKDNLFTLKEVECLGACVCAPVVQINDDYYENVTEDMVEEIICRLRNSE